ncbi:hypothetical protein LXA43DRAFT_1063072 [Ganoderma leucocontextum]|nr:hypothetical protein LXA43DRAFT_1063072 [Ganoderma leucocontextum]
MWRGRGWGFCAGPHPVDLSQLERMIARDENCAEGGQDEGSWVGRRKLSCLRFMPEGSVGAHSSVHMMPNIVIAPHVSTACATTESRWNEPPSLFNEDNWSHVNIYWTRKAVRYMEGDTGSSKTVKIYRPRNQRGTNRPNEDLEPSGDRTSMEGAWAIIRAEGQQSGCWKGENTEAGGMAMWGGTARGFYRARTQHCIDLPEVFTFDIHAYGSLDSAPAHACCAESVNHIRSIFQASLALPSPDAGHIQAHDGQWSPAPTRVNGERECNTWCIIMARAIGGAELYESRWKGGSAEAGETTMCGGTVRGVYRAQTLLIAAEQDAAGHDVEHDEISREGMTVCSPFDVTAITTPEWCEYVGRVRHPT